MGKQIDKINDLGYLGLDFQFKLVKALQEDSQFFQDIASIVNQNSFTDPLLRSFVGLLKDYYNENGTCPSYETLGTIYKRNAKVSTDIEEWDALVKKLKFETSTEGYDTIRETALKFFKQQHYSKVANKIIEMIQSGDLDRCDQIQRLFEEASMIGQEDDLGFNIFDMEDKALANDYTVSIPTGISMLDETLGGGLDKGKLGLIIAPAGFGKTSITTSICSYAATYKCDINNNEGFKVLQIYFEDDDVDVTRKHFAKKLSEGLPEKDKIEARQFRRLDHESKMEISELLANHKDREMLKKNLRLKKFKTGTKSATDIGIFVKKLINSGFKPDMISIDYFECIAPEKGGYSTDTEWTREGVTMRVLENLAHELNCAIWIPTQGTKDSMNSPDVVRMDQASGSAKKVHVAQLILSIARAIDDIDHSRATVSILKNRSGKSGKVFKNVYFNNGTCEISCENVEVFNDQLAWEADNEREKETHRVNTLQTLVKKKDEITHNQEYSSGGNFVGRLNSDINPNKEFEN